MINSAFSQFDVDYISGAMSLRKPQKVSLKRLEDILSEIDLSKKTDKAKALSDINNLFPTCTDFERDFISLTFALATGVGKTRLMGAFITYLYTQHGIKNFFIVAPSTTVYDKLKRDLGDPSNPKYVFKGLGCFSSPPEIIADDDYRQKRISELNSDINIFVFNIDKFNRDEANMKKVNEYIGDSFFSYLSNIDDLTIIMDESHHYRAKSGAKALNELNPLLGLELTATPTVNIGSKPVNFKNVVYEYPLSKAIEDGYTRTPYAVTRSDINFYGFGDEQLDKLMLNDGVQCHENIKSKLEVYADNAGVAAVKPFMLVVCKDTEHADKILAYIKSNDFREGRYINKVITVHSSQRGGEKDENVKLLLDVEQIDNPIEIVIHVNMLKEGWDVNNLYTIVPLRTAASKILREQMVGRGLRLPYGQRTGNKEIDAVMLTAHDKFEELLREAQSGDSIFKAGNVIKIDEVPTEIVTETQLTADIDLDEIVENTLAEVGLEKNAVNVEMIEKTIGAVNVSVDYSFTAEGGEKIKEDNDFEILETEIENSIKADKDLAKVYAENKNPILLAAREYANEKKKSTKDKFIPIPQLKIIDPGNTEYEFEDFDLNFEEFNHAPISNELLINNLIERSESERIEGSDINFEGYNAKSEILAMLREKPEIEYEKDAELLHKLLTSLEDYYRSKYTEEQTKNIAMMNKKEIAESLFAQMLLHTVRKEGLLLVKIEDQRNENFRQKYSHVKSIDLYESYDEDIRKILFTGIKYGVFSSAKFDSYQELILARILEREISQHINNNGSANPVKNWLRPAPSEFNISYGMGKRYEPDFVVETENIIYLIEVKAFKDMNN
ncbi:MAG: DEAD/DEAH box helicase, partial [Anaerovoracaceae bacterium]